MEEEEEEGSPPLPAEASAPSPDAQRAFRDIWVGSRGGSPRPGEGRGRLISSIVADSPGFLLLWPPVNHCMASPTSSQLLEVCASYILVMVDKVSGMSDLNPCEHQVGGWHKGAQSCVLKDQQGLILKPLKLNANPTYNQILLVSKSTKQSEIVKQSDEELIPVCRDELGFYEHLKTSTSPDDTALKLLMPTFHGSRHVVMKDGQEVPHLVLEDLAAGLQLPCVIDIKIGHSFYYPGKEHYLQKTKSAAQRELGYCLTGLRVFHPETGYIITELRPDVCKKLSTSQVFKELETFCQCDFGFSNNLRHALVTQLLCIHEWFLKQRSYKIRCSSILMVYDASQLVTQQQMLESPSAGCVTAAVNDEPVFCEFKPKVTVKMIDFAHVLYSHGERDENYLFGLENLIKFFNKTVE